MLIGPPPKFHGTRDILEVYRHSPVLMPWLIRDPSCRANPAKNIPEQWGAPDARGFMRADNTPIKNLPRNLAVRGPKGSHFNGRRLGSEFVASHIWRKVNAPELASRVPLLNTFVPNLVWLPSQVSKLSDIDGGVVQQALKAMSRKIYGAVSVESHLEPVVNDAWSLLPESDSEVDIHPENLNWFAGTEGFLNARKTGLLSVIRALSNIEAGEPLTKKVITTRYTLGLPEVSDSHRRSLMAFLSRFVAEEK